MRVQLRLVSKYKGWASFTIVSWTASVGGILPQGRRNKTRPDAFHTLHVLIPPVCSVTKSLIS